MMLSKTQAPVVGFLALLAVMTGCHDHTPSVAPSAAPAAAPTSGESPAKIPIHEYRLAAEALEEWADGFNKAVKESAMVGAKEFKAQVCAVAEDADAVEQQYADLLDLFVASRLESHYRGRAAVEARLLSILRAQALFECEGSYDEESLMTDCKDVREEGKKGDPIAARNASAALVAGILLVHQLSLANNESLGQIRKMHAELFATSAQDVIALRDTLLGHLSAFSFEECDSIRALDAGGDVVAVSLHKRLEQLCGPSDEPASGADACVDPQPRSEGGRKEPEPARSEP